MSQAIRFAECLPDENDKNESILDICIGLIDFWINCIDFFCTRKRGKPARLQRLSRCVPLSPSLLTFDPYSAFDNPGSSWLSGTLGEPTDPWSDLDNDFNKSKTDIDHIIITLRNLAEVAAHPPTASETSSLALFPTISREEVQFPILLLPIPDNPGFIGRVSLLERMDQHLNPSRKEVGFRCFTVYGTGGFGKTQVALKYAYRHRDAYDAIFWIDSETPVSTRQSFLEVALILRLPGVDKRDNAEQVRIAVDTWLRTTSQSAPSLLSSR